MLCPLDDRNYQKIEPLAKIFSEFSLNKTRIFVEIEYLLALSKAGVLTKKLKQNEIVFLRSIWNNFNDEEHQKLKLIEKKTNHDIKSIEYYLKTKIVQKDLKYILPFIHFGLTSEDINNLSYGLLILQSKHQVLTPKLKFLISNLVTLAHFSKDFPMLSRTHGQPASPTTFGKEVMIFVSRLTKELKIWEELTIEGKLNGAVGNYNALYLCFPKIDWMSFSEKFIKQLFQRYYVISSEVPLSGTKSRNLGGEATDESLRIARSLACARDDNKVARDDKDKARNILHPNLITSQILPYDSWIRHFDSLKRINNILINLVTDFWWYASLGYLKLKVIKAEVGSSTMPHKINPIDLEAAEGNLGFSNAMLHFFSEKLSKTRLQHDLSDSTVRRNIGMALGYSYFSYDSILRALSRLEPDKEVMLKDLQNHPEILAEAYQNLLKLEGREDAYEDLKKLTRGKNISKKDWEELLAKGWSALGGKKSKLSAKVKSKLQSLKPETYLGLAGKLVSVIISLCFLN